MSDNSEGKKPTILYDSSFERTYGSILSELGCDGIGVPIAAKTCHFLIQPDMAVYIWNPNGEPKRIFEEITIFRKNFPHRLIIIEGAADGDHAQIFCGLQMRIWLEGHEAMQPSLTRKDTCMILKSLATRLQIKDNPPAMNRPKPNNDLIKLHQNLIEGLIGTGSQKAEILMDHFGSGLVVCEQIIRHPYVIQNIKGFGPEFIAANKILLNEIKKNH